MDRMELGGNAAFTNFMDHYGISRMNINKKYHTKAAKYYRVLLDSRQKKENLTEVPPSKKEGVQVEGAKIISANNQLTGFGSDDLLPNPKKEKKKRSRSRFKEGWEKGKRKMGKWTSNISKKFGKIFRRSKSKSKKRHEKKEEEIPNDDVSMSNDSTFEIKNMKRSKKEVHQNRFNEDLVSFKKHDKQIEGKSISGWKKYLNKSSRPKMTSDYLNKIRIFKSQNSYAIEPPISTIENGDTTQKNKDFKSLSDTENFKKELTLYCGQIEEKKNEENITYQDPFFKKELQAKKVTNLD
mgnify:CR=1 FL=1